MRSRTAFTVADPTAYLDDWEVKECINFFRGYLQSRDPGIRRAFDRIAEQALKAVEEQQAASDV